MTENGIESLLPDTARVGEYRELRRLDQAPLATSLPEEVSCGVPYLGINAAQDRVTQHVMHAKEVTMIGERRQQPFNGAQCSFRFGSEQCSRSSIEICRETIANSAP